MELKAVRALASIHAAQADFRANDRDGNGVPDFWTGDVAGLLRYGLIDRATAEADTRPLRPLVPLPIPSDGYYFRALDADGSIAPPETYRQETDRTSGKVHHPSSFGFVAYPAEPGATGSQILIINENGTVFGCRANIPVPNAWPDDPSLVASWAVYGRLK